MTMTALLLTTLFLLTIISAFALGIAMGYWVIFGILNLFEPGRNERKSHGSPALIHTLSGD